LQLLFTRHKNTKALNFLVVLTSHCLPLCAHNLCTCIIYTLNKVQHVFIHYGSTLPIISAGSVLCALFLARESRIFTLLEELRSEVMEMKDILTSLQLRTVYPDADSTVKVLREFDLKLKD